MNRITLLLLNIIISLCLFSQTPQAFKYQAVVRDSDGIIISNQEVSFRIGIRDSIPTGIVIYQESHTLFTNDFGVANLEIGNGTPITGLMTDIDWQNNDKFLEVELDLAGGSTYVSLGTTQLLAVPYALHSETTGDTTRWKKGDTGDLYYNDGFVGIGIDEPTNKLDIRGSHPDDGITLSVGNSDLSHQISLFGGRQNDPNPFIFWKDGDPLRFCTDEDGWTEKMRITSDGKVGIGTESPEESAALDINSIEKGFLLPRMTSEQISNIANPANGLQVYNTDNDKLYIFVSSQGQWKEVSYGTSSLPTTGSFEIGTGGNCNNTVINGVFMENINLSSLEFVNIDVNVTSVGNYTVLSDTINGYHFIASGTFTSIGIHSINLLGEGTPISPQYDLFTVWSVSGTGTCTFEINTVPYAWQCGDTIIDFRDSQIYNTVLIGAQCWMAENLNIGTIINGFEDQVNNSIIEKYCYDNNASHCDDYGGLYQWDEMMEYGNIEGSQGICPAGWHLPTDNEWCTLENEVDIDYIDCNAIGYRGYDAGRNLKSNSLWNGSNNYGFNALPAGNYYDYNYYSEWESTYFWTSTENTGAIDRGLTDQQWRIARYDADKLLGQSVRCISD